MQLWLGKLDLCNSRQLTCVGKLMMRLGNSAEQVVKGVEAAQVKGLSAGN